jgi:hypothetical protein
MANLNVNGGDRGQAVRQLHVPWLDYASTVMPTNHELIMWWAQYLWLTDGNYRSAFGRVISHFITNVQFPALSENEESEFKDLFQKHLNYQRELKAAGSDLLCYGNVFLSIYLPFKRNLSCPHCYFEQPIKHVDYTIDLTSQRGVRWLRKKPCPQCGNTQDFVLRDRKDPDISRIRVLRYSPFEIELAQNFWSQRKNIWWRIPNDFRQDIMSKARIFIDDTPIEVLEAVAVNGRLLFDEDMIYHVDEPVISGMRTRGWGVPASISNFRTFWLQQILNRADQAIASDYTLGLRLISPAMANQNDPMIQHGMDNFVGGMNRIINAHRAEPMSYHTAPYPVNYQFLGGEGKDLLPADKLKFRQQESLNQCNVPLEYHQMTLTAQAAPMALRLFESAWSAVPSMYTSILQWIVKVAARNFGLEETDVRIQRSTIADDQERKNILMQLMAANQISPQTALEPLGVLAGDEARKVFKHQEFIQELQQEQDDKAVKDQEMGAVSALAGAQSPSAMLQQQQQAAQQQGGAGAPPPGMPMGGAPMGGLPAGGGANAGTLSGMASQAEQIAGQLAGMPEWDRKQQLKALREGNKDLHGLVKSKLDEIRQQASSQGQQMLLQGGQGGQPPGGGGAPQ